MARLEESTYHIPVMATECLDMLRIRPDGTYCDGTLGGGGHTSLILERLNDEGRLYSFDADDVAIRHCTERFADELARGDDSRLILVHTNFEEMPDVMRDKRRVDGILLDLGVSSYQFDHHGRGFSFRQQAPLDMRFTAEGETAADILNTRDEAEIARIIFDYGEDPSARRIAAAIVQRRRIAAIRTTIDVRDIVVGIIPPQHQPRTMARVFQALRIAVNRELERLEHVLVSMIPLLAPGGRLVVMSYHSLEDRIVKNVFRDHGRDALTILTKRPIEPSSEEIARNPRSRSARLRVAEKTAGER